MSIFDAPLLKSINSDYIPPIEFSSSAAFNELNPTRMSSIIAQVLQIYQPICSDVLS